MKTLLLLLTLGTVTLSAREDLSSLDAYIHSHMQRVTEGYVTEAQQTFFTSFLQNEKRIITIAEIGFNAGHSSETLLLARPNTQVTSFDLMMHDYTATGKKYIDIKYPGRHTMVAGDSRVTVNKFAKENPGVTFDLIFIDGGHGYDIAKTDIMNMKKLARADTLVVFDDIQYKRPRRAWERCVEKGIVEEIERFGNNERMWVLGKYRFN